MRKLFNPGERVRVFCTSGHWDGTVERMETVTFKVGQGPVAMVRVKQSPGVTYRQHPNQVRRLKKKVRREVWINFYDDRCPTSHGSKENADLASSQALNGRRECVHYREVRK